ncbi:hypothetical protein KBB96_02010 [Luteolibacter ambystomatis]|uniref:Uncharacterized protein n=1 Tax=Luteolibacter ambystomatis TaxID=2824561 RepID=A0A975J0B7_9BACT|nr:hypothetical protein [Luteolibacter ambystomatis]QUE51678.1 hypothetical protein KBB96_02010 [Luteolibacter ambystomatis]
MAIEHPFQALFETFGRLPIVHAETVNRQAYEQLWDLLAVDLEQSGRCILLKAPRAGHGKTHLLSRLQHHLGQGHEFIPLHAAHGSLIDAATATADTLARLGRSLPAGGGLTVLDLLVRRLFAQALQPLVRSGEVPCQDREGALAALRNRPIETFDFHHPNAVTAHWAKENFEVLGPRLALELAQRSTAPLREVMFWVDALFRFASTPVDHPLRAGALMQTVAVAGLPESQVFERLATLLGLVSQLVRVVLVADDLEGFSADESAALRLAAFLGSLRHSAERIDAIVSVNRDIWESAFLPRLSAGLADRLAEVVVELEPLGRHEIIALLDARAPGLGGRVYERLDLNQEVHHARGILRAAGDAWVHAARQNAQAPPAAVAPRAVELEPQLHIPAVADEPATVTVTPPAAVAAAVAAAVTEETHERNHVEVFPPVEAATPPVATDAPLAFQIPEPESPVQLGESVPLPTEERPPKVWSFEPTGVEIPVARLIPNPIAAPPQDIPVATLVPEPAAAEAFQLPPVASEPPPIAPEVQEPVPVAYVPSPGTFHETPLSEVLATEAAHDAPPVSWPAPQAVPAAASPFQAAPPQAAVYGEAEPAGFAAAASTHAPVYAEANTATVPAGPPPVPASHAAPADTPAPETDRVDELLRQFRERYAKG